MLVGDTLDSSPDHVLEGIVAMAALELGRPGPASHCSSIGRSSSARTAGCPNQLAIPRSMESVGSFCERVVRDQAPVEIEDALANPSDQIPYDRWGVRSYLGVPVFIGDVCVGTLCALDPQPRRYERALRPRLVEWGVRASARLAELARRPSLRRGGVQHVLRPSFAEIGNSLTPVFGQLGDARTTLDALIADRDEAAESLERLRTAVQTVEQRVRADSLDAVIATAGAARFRADRDLRARAIPPTSSRVITPSWSAASTGRFRRSR